MFTPKPEEQTDQTDVSIAVVSPVKLKLLTFAAQLAVVAGLGWMTRPKLTRGSPDSERAFLVLGQGAALLLAMVLLSPMSSKAHFCALLVPISFCLADFLYRRHDWVVGVSLLVVFVLGTLTAKQLIPGKRGDHVLAYGTVTGCALMLMVATGRILVQRSQEARIRGMVVGRAAHEPLAGAQQAA